MSKRPDHDTSEPQPLGLELAERVGMRVESTIERRYFFGPEREHNKPIEVPAPRQGVSVEIHIPPSSVILIEEGEKYPDLQARVVLRQPSLDGGPEEGWLPLGGLFEAEASIRDGSLRLYEFDGDLHLSSAGSVIELRREHVFPLIVVIRESTAGSE